MRSSAKVYKNKFYKDGKHRIVILSKDSNIVSCNSPYGWWKDNEFKKI